MSFIRPEAAAFLKKWREAIIAGVILLGSLQAASATNGAMNAFAWVTALIGAALFIEGVRRARLPDRAGGVGVVDVDERQITYFGPHGGGAISINDLQRIKCHGQVKVKLILQKYANQSLKHIYLRKNVELGLIS